MRTFITNYNSEYKDIYKYYLDLKSNCTSNSTTDNDDTNNNKSIKSKSKIKSKSIAVPSTVIPYLSATPKSHSWVCLEFIYLLSITPLSNIYLIFSVIIYYIFYFNYIIYKLLIIYLYV
jgi:hypothetical protein